MSRISDAIDALRGRGRKEQAEQKAVMSNHHVSSVCSSYENMFAQVRPLVDEMKTVRPYGVGNNGARLARSRTPELNVLDAPNDQMGWADFMDTALVIWLTESEVDIKVHRRANGSVYGYTILPARSIRYNADGTVYFEYQSSSWTTERIGEEEVMRLRYSRNPFYLDTGISPTSSVEIWAQIDDLIAQYQKAFFENGAVPATITFISARSRADYDAKRADLERGLKGAKNRNKTVYAWRQTLDDDSSKDEIEVKTIQPANSSLALSQIIDVVNDRLNKSIGVSNFILGDDSSAKYDNAELSDHQFTKRRVCPALVSFWSAFQQELDRILGGLGYAISFDLEIPELTDRVKTQAETHNIQSDALIKLILAGARPADAVTALGLSEDWEGVARGIARKANAEQVEPVEVATESVQDAVIVENRVIDLYEPTWEQGEEQIKQIYDLMIGAAEEIAAERDLDVDEVKRQLVEYLRIEAQKGAFDGAQSVLEKKFDYPKLNEAMQEIVNTNSYNFSNDFIKTIDERAGKIVDKFVGDTRKIVAEIFAKAKEEGITQNELASRLSEAMPTARAEMIARNETHHAINAGRIELDQNIDAEYGLKTTIVWQAWPGACDICKAMDGTEIPVGEAFPDHCHVHTEDGQEYEASWKNDIYNSFGQVPSPHANCKCTFREKTEIVR